MASLKRFARMLPDHLRLPDDDAQVQPFTLRSVIGAGAGGTALAATLTSNESERRCIKIMEVSTLEPRYAEVLERCRLEALSLSRCSSVFVVKYYDSFEVADPGRNVVYFALVCEECAAGDLRNQVKLRVAGRHGVGIFSEVEALLLFVQVLMALNHIHERRMMHRDLKTGNIFMTGIGAVKLGDFGFAKSFQDSLSMSDTPCGTPDMMAPELWQRNRYTRKVDMYALGVVLYELLSGRRPYDVALKGQRSMDAIAKASVELEPDALPEDVSEMTCTIVMALLKKDPAERPTCRDLMRSQHIITSISKLESVLPKSPEHASFRCDILKEIEENKRFMMPGHDDVVASGMSQAALELHVAQLLASQRSQGIGGSSYCSAIAEPDSVMAALWVGAAVKKKSAEGKWKSRFLRVASLDGSQFDLALVVTLDSTPLNLIPSSQKQVIRLKFVDDVHSLTPEHADGREHAVLVANCRSPNFVVQFAELEVCNLWVILLKEVLTKLSLVLSASSGDNTCDHALKSSCGSSCGVSASPAQTASP